MGRNRKWVLEDNLSQTVWRTILRGPHPPPGSWQCGMRQNSSSMPAKGTGGFNQGEHHSNRTGRELLRVQGIQAAPQRLSPDERVSEARARVLRLEAALPIGERLKFADRSRARIETRPKHLLQRGSNQQCPDPSPNGRPPVPMDVENPMEEVRRLRAQVADLQQERALGGKRWTKAVLGRVDTRFNVEGNSQCFTMPWSVRVKKSEPERSQIQTSETFEEVASQVPQCPRRCETSTLVTERWRRVAHKSLT